MKDALYKKFTEVPTRRGRGGTYAYVKWQDVADRMNQIFEIKWSSEVVYQDVVNSNIIVRVRVTATDVNTGNSFFQEGFGGAPVDDRQEAGTPFKSAYSKALKDACKKWGVGLYIDEDEDQNLTGLNKVPADIPVIPVDTPVIPVDTPVIPSSSTQRASMVPPTTDNTVTNTVTIKQNGPQIVPPVTPMPVPDIKPVNSGDTLGNNITISDVQKAALQSILSIQGVEYEELVKDAFSAKGIVVSKTVPTIDNLLYKEAVTVIKYGNDKFRNH